MDRRAFVRTIGLAIVAAPVSVEAQHASKAARIGVLWFTLPSISAPFFEALRDGLRDLGYVEGQNIAFEQRWAEKNPHRYPELAAELVRLKVDVIVAGNLESARAAKDATPAWKRKIRARCPDFLVGRQGLEPWTR
jgi:putative tryptophan/tyrosine transport system substrate-binding protein